MANLNEIYRCKVCGNIVEMVHIGGGSLVCCGQEMELLKENTTDAAIEKHVPVASKEGNKLSVKVGEVPHPMEEAHFIEWIEVIAGEKVLRQQLKPGQEAVAQFEVESETFEVRAFCNLHGLWSKKQS